jgi:hypothetical protein
MGLGPFLPLAELARRDSTLFMEVKHLFSTTPVAKIFSRSSWIETEVNGGHWGDQTLNRMRSRHDRTRPVSSSHMLRTHASARLVRRQRDNKCKGSIGCGGAFGHDRPDTSDRVWMLTEID